MSHFFENGSHTVKYSGITSQKKKLEKPESPTRLFRGGFSRNQDIFVNY